MENILNKIRSEGNENQSKLAVASLVKSLSENQLFYMRNYVFQYLALEYNFEIEHVNFLYQDGFGLSNVETGPDGDKNAYLRLDSRYKDSSNKEVIDLTFIGIGRILANDHQLEVHRARLEGINWINRFHAKVFVDLKDGDDAVQQKYVTYFSSCIYTWLSNNADKFLSMHEDKESFINMLTTLLLETKEVKDINRRLNNAIVATIFNGDKEAITYFNHYINLITMPPSEEISVPKPSSAEFMSMYLFACFTE